MAEQRPIWRGQLRLALVSCPVALFSTNHDRGTLHFNLINPDTGNRIRMITEDAETGAELSRQQLVKGYEYQKDKYLILSDEDFESARIESSSTMKIEKFVEGDSIDPIYFDSSYYLATDGKGAEDVYLVLREAIEKTGKVALTRVVIARRERVLALRPMGKGLVAHTLHEERDLNSPAKAFEGVPDGKADPEMVALAVQLIERQSGRFDPADFEDRYETRIRNLIDAKLKGEGLEPAEEDTRDSGNVIDLMDALRRSLGKPIAEKERVPAKAAGARAPAKRSAKPPAKTPPAKQSGARRTR
jgi:DNA end-binding protein Ku